MNGVSLKKYENYSDSKVEWLGDVPSHWVVTRNKDIFEERGSLSKTGDEILLTVSHITGVTKRSEKNVNMFMAETHEGYKHCKQGDLIINTMWAWMGALGTANEEGICSPAYGVYKPKNNVPYNHRYFDYLYRTPQAVTEMTRNSKGIVSSRLRLYPKDFFQIKTTLPSEVEQNNIVKYIDSNLKIIDKKIQILQQKEELYEELKSALISDTIKRGLNHTITMKDSEVEWQGKIPAHWNQMRVKGFLNFKKGKTPKLFGDNKNDSPYLSMDYLRGRDKVIDYVPYRKDLMFVGDDDLLILWDGANAGEVVRAMKGCLSSTMAVIKFKSYKFCKEYLYYFLKSMEQRFKDLSNGTTIPHFSPRVLTDQVFYIPDYKEQESISNFLKQKANHINLTVKSIRTQIEKLEEVRIALISDAVTGKIEVMGEGYKKGHAA